jgi:hypothetical protein
MNDERQVGSSLARLGTGAATAAVATILLTACTESSHHDAVESSKTTATPKAVGLPNGVVGATDVPTTVPNKADLRKNVAISSCEAVEGGWAASGTASNPGKNATSYTITIFFTTDQATVISTGQTTVQVQPDGKQSWSVNQKFTAPAHTLCVLRGVGQGL